MQLIFIFAKLCPVKEKLLKRIFQQTYLRKLSKGCCCLWLCFPQIFINNIFKVFLQNNTTLQTPNGTFVQKIKSNAKRYRLDQQVNHGTIFTTGLIKYLPNGVCMNR